MSELYPSQSRPNGTASIMWCSCRDGGGKPSSASHPGSGGLSAQESSHRIALPFPDIRWSEFYASSSGFTAIAVRLASVSPVVLVGGEDAVARQPK